MAYIQILRTLKNLEDKGSNMYTKAIIKECDKQGIKYIITEVGSEHEFNKHLRMNGIPTLVMQPCEYGIPEFFKNSNHNLERHCTAKVVRKLIHEIVGDTVLKNSDVLIINRSELIGRPLANMLLDDDYTVTIAHSKTKELQKLINNSVIIVCATGNDLTEYDMTNKIVLDVSDDYKDTATVYVGRKKIGSMTVATMLEGVKHNAKMS